MAFSEAVDYFSQAIRTQESIGDRSGLAYSFTHLGHTQISMGEFAEAIDSFERAIELRQAIDERGHAHRQSGGLCAGAKPSRRECSRRRNRRSRFWTDSIPKAMKVSSIQYACT